MEGLFDGPSALSRDEVSTRLGVVPGALIAEALSLGAGLSSNDVLQLMAGVYECEGDSVCFLPRFPFADGVEYAVLVDNQVVHTIKRAATLLTPTTDVVAIYPTASAVPVNLLKMYVQFSAPMSEGGADRAIQVSLENGEPLKDVFLNSVHELWNLDHTRLTLLLDPGRIKRGLVPHEQTGYPLIEGRSVVFTVTEAFRDADGHPLRERAAARFNVVAPVRARVDEASWRYRVPRAGSRDPFEVEFDRPLDRALLERCLWIHERNGALVSGRATIGPEERSWCFEPANRWTAGRHVLRINARLEDLAGNSLNRVFDRDLERPEDDPRDAAYVEVTFTPGADDAGQLETGRRSG